MISLLLYPKAIEDIKCTVLFKKTNNIYCIGNIQIDNYIFAKEKQKDSIMLFLDYSNGNNSLEDIEKFFLEVHHLIIDVNEMYDLCKKNGFIQSEDLNETFIKPKSGFNDLELFMVDIFSLSLDKLEPFISFISKRLKSVVILILVTTVFFLFLLLQNIYSYQSLEINWSSILSNPLAIIFYMIISTLSIFIHELAHVIVSYRYGIKPKVLTFALYAYITPMIYVRLKGVYFIEPIKRILIWSSGAFMNFFLSLIFFVLMNFSYGNIRLFFLTGVTVNVILGLSSLMPLVSSDGYYILSTLLKVPNLRKDSFSHISKILKGQVRKESIAYIIYCFIFVGAISLILIIGLHDVITLIIEEIRNGMNFLQIALRYINVLIFSLIGIFSKVIMFFMKKKKEKI